MKINYVNGDATSPQGEGNKVIGHISNDIGAWGSGFVMALSRKWEQPESLYRMFSGMDALILGDIQVAQVEKDITVVNMVAQTGILSKMVGDTFLPPIRYEAVRSCLRKVNHYCIANNATLHAPRFGSDRAGGDWNVIEKIILDEIEVEVTIYDLN